MTLSAVQVLSGPGLVARFGDVLLWLEEGDDGGKPVVGRLLDLARALAESGDGRSAGEQAAEVLRRDPRAVPAMVLVAASPTGLHVVVHGWGRVLADGVDIDGGWVDRDLAWPTAFAAGRGGDLLRVPTPGSVLDLHRGSTPGGGAAVALAAQGSGAASGPHPHLTPQPAGAGPRPASTAQAGIAFAPVDLRGSPARHQPLPPGGAADDPTSGVTVKGIVCSRGHLNNPVAVVCRACGGDLGPASRVLQDGIRPSLGALVLDDGTTFGLDADHLVGRAPDGAPPASGGGARPITLVDPSGQLAPLHAEVRLVGWDVVLVARAPTFVLAPGTQQWAPAPPGQPSHLPAGARIAVGQRTIVLCSAEAQAPPPGAPSPSGRP